MLTNGGLHVEAAVLWSRCCSHQALILQRSSVESAEPGTDCCRMSYRYYSIMLPNIKMTYSNFFCAHVQVTVALQDSGAHKKRQHGHRIISHRLPSQLWGLSIGPNSYPTCIRAVCQVHLEHWEICEYQDAVCPASIGGQHYRTLT